jgi:hypothetical protein
MSKAVICLSRNHNLYIVVYYYYYYYLGSGEKQMAQKERYTKLFYTTKFGCGCIRRFYPRLSVGTPQVLWRICIPHDKRVLRLKGME